MNVIDGQAGSICYANLIFYSLTIDNILNIIVLIILAMVTIAMLTGPNGLLNKALEAQIANDKAEIQDRAETEVLASIGTNGKIDWGELKKNLAENFGIEEETIEEKKDGENVTGLTFTVEKNKRNYEVNIDEKGKVTVKYEGKGSNSSAEPSEEPSTEPSEEEILISSKTKGEWAEKEEKEIPTPSGGEIKTDGNGEKIPIPSGFTYKEGNVSDGAVVTAKDGSEFVWVPVKNAIAKSEKTAKQTENLTIVTITITATPKEQIREITNETEDNIEKISDTEYKVTENGTYKFKITTKSGEVKEHSVNVQKIQKGTEVNKAMAVKDPTNENNYRGVLYDFARKDSYVITRCTTTNDDCREPAYLTSYDGNIGSGFNTVGLTEDGLKGEYKAMIESVAKYGGFYVGRYETSLSGNKAQSKSGQTPMSAETGSGNTWWGMYEKEKNYASINGIESIVGSSMIWGSQYDAMLNWILKGSDAEKVVKASEEHAKTTTGSTSGDVMNKIYDLGNNLYEWTLEANGTDSRVKRGGYYYGTGSPSTRSYGTPSYTHDNYGSRFTLYIK